MKSNEKKGRGQVKEKAGVPLYHEIKELVHKKDKQKILHQCVPSLQLVDRRPTLSNAFGYTIAFNISYFAHPKP